MPGALSTVDGLHKIVDIFDGPEARIAFMDKIDYFTHADEVGRRTDRLERHRHRKVGYP